MTARPHRCPRTLNGPSATPGRPPVLPAPLLVYSGRAKGSTRRKALTPSLQSSASAGRDPVLVPFDRPALRRARQVRRPRPGGRALQAGHFPDRHLGRLARQAAQRHCQLGIRRQSPVEQMVGRAAGLQTLRLRPAAQAAGRSRTIDWACIVISAVGEWG